MFEFLFKYPRDDYARSELLYVGDWPGWLLTLLVVVAVAGLAVLLYRRRAFVGLPKLTVVFVLQLCMLALVLWVLMQPTLSTQRLRAGDNSVALLLDGSESMAYGLSQPRFQDATSSLVASLANAPNLDLSVQRYAFAESLNSLTAFADVEPSGTATSIADALTSVLREARFSPLAAVVLSSDGADTNGGISAAQLAEIAGFGVPVHTIAVGREAIAEDLELTDILLPKKALPGSSVTARVSVRHDAAASTRLKVYDADELLASVPLELGADVRTTTAWVDIELADAGHHNLQFSIDGIPGERELRNNSRSTLLEVVDQQYRILYFEGEPRWEYKFLRRAVAADDDLDIVSLLRVSPNKFYRQGIESAEQLEDGFPKTREELFGYDALIIGSVEAASLSDEQQKIIHDFVSERGGALLMLAGPNGLGNGGWGQSAIADVLPVSLPPSAIDTFFRKKATASLTAQGMNAQMLRFADTDEANLESWRELPEVADYQVLGSLKPAAVAYLNVATDSGVQPLLVTQPFGRGHAYVLATGGTWRWQMSLPVDDQRHEIFWRQTLRAMVSSALDSVVLTIGADADSQSVPIRAEFRDDAFEPLDDIGVSVVVSHEAGESWSIVMRASPDEPGVFLAEATPNASGTWYFEAVAERNYEPVGVARASMYHESGRAEYFNLRRNSTLLQRISEVTGGQYLQPDSVDALPDLLRYGSSGITEAEYRPIWDAPAVFLLLLMLKAAEWMLRRRWSTI